MTFNIMSPLNIINIITIIENVMGIFRNYLFFKPGFKKLTFYIVLIMCVNIYGCTLFYQTAVLVMKFRTNDRNMNIYSLIYYNFASITICSAAIILALYNRQSFKIFVESVFAIHKLCKDDVIYQISVKKLNKRVLLVSFLFVGLSIFETVCFFLTYLKDKDVFVSVYFSAVVLIDLTLEYRYIVEGFTFYVLCDVVVFCLQYLSSSVNVSVKLKHEHLGGVDFLELEDNLKKWGVVSRHLLICVDQLSSSFGFLMGLILSAATIQHIMLIYKAVCVVKIPELRAYTLTVRIISSNNILVMLLIIASGQRVRFRAEKLDRDLASMCNLLEAWREADGCARSARALCRRLRAAPLRVRLLGRPVEMSLLTAVLAITADYTIVLLQFNHVV